MNAPARPSVRSAAGFSLVEIMVAMLVSLFLLAGVLQLYLGNQQTSRLGTGVGDLQQTGQFALDELANNLRMAAFQGCADAVRVTAPVLALNAPTTDLSLPPCAASRSPPTAPGPAAPRPPTGMARCHGP